MDNERRLYESGLALIRRGQRAGLFPELLLAEQTQGDIATEEGAANTPTIETIATEHIEFIQHILLRMGVRPADLPDVAQKVLLGAARRLFAFDPSIAANPKTALRSWLYAICQRQSANLHRTKRRKREDLLSNDELDLRLAEGPDVETRLIAEEDRALLAELLDTLSPELKAIVVAHELDGQPMDEIANDCGIPYNTAWDRLRRGRRDLKAAWAQRNAIERYQPVRRGLSSSRATFTPEGTANGGKWPQGRRAPGRIHG